MVTSWSIEQTRQLRERVIQIVANSLVQPADSTDLVSSVVTQVEREGNLPYGHYVFGAHVLTPHLARTIEQEGKHWISSIPGSQVVQWGGPWVQLEEVAARLRHTTPKSFRPLRVLQGNEETLSLWAFTKSTRLDAYGRKRLVIAHQRENCTDPPLLLFSSALHWEAKRILELWPYRMDISLFAEDTPHLQDV
ncbi:MAG: hypothetical protein AB7G75_18730 [Candidatus Binatia bacterium]